jgi:trigger factor
LSNYHEIKVEVPEIQVTDEDVDAELKHLQERQASFDPVDEDRPLRDGDFAQVSFEAIPKEATPETASGAEESGVAKPIASQPVKMDEVFVEIGGANTQAEFSENLRGAKPGDERIFDVTYPPDHYDRRLAGKTLSYTSKVGAIKKKIIPELTDDFAKELSPDFQTVEDLRKRLHEGILAERQHRNLTEAREKLLHQLAETHDFPVPESMIQKQIDFRLEQWLRSLAAQGMRTEDMKRMDFRSIRSSQREAAAKEVKSHLLLEKIADAENIQATDGEVNQEIHALSQQAKQTPANVQQRLGEAGMERIRRRIRSDKVLQFLYDRSTSQTQNSTV